MPGDSHSRDTVDQASVTSPGILPVERSLELVAIYRQHADFVWRTLQRMGVQEPHLEDVTQEVFVVVHKRLHTFDGSSRMTTWLYGICLRVASQWRKRAWNRRETAVEEPPERNSQPGRAGDDFMQVQEAQRRIRLVLDRMDVEKRAVFVMYEIEEMSTTEIADVLGIPSGTVHSRLHAAREQFRTVLSRLDARAFRGGAS